MAYNKRVERIESPEAREKEIEMRGRSRGRASRAHPHMVFSEHETMEQMIADGIRAKKLCAPPHRVGVITSFIKLLGKKSSE